MSTVKITDLTALTDPSSTDVLPIVDVGASATKKLTIADLMENAGSGSAPTPGISFDGDPDTGIARLGDNNIALCTTATNRLDIGAAGVIDIKLGGSASTPALIFEGDVNTGISHAADTLTFSTAGSSRLDIGSGGVIDIKSGGSASAPALIFGGDTNTGISHAADTLTFSTAGSSRFIIDSSGNVGIGTDSPQQQAGIGLHIHNPDSQARIKLTQSGSGATANDGFDIIAETGNEIHLINHESAALKFGVGTERMRIDSSGRLLAGTSTYTGNGQVAFAGNSSSGTAAGIVDIRPTLSRPTAADTTLSLIRFGSADHSGNTGYASINVASDGASASDSDLPGRLEFHTTSDGASSPTEKMRIASTGLISAPGVYSFTTASSANVIVESAGQLSRATSSIKYKRNVETLEDSYADAILNCRPVWYQSKSELDNPDHGFWGFIAEEVAEIDPRLVQWKTNEITYDENGASVATPCEPEAESVAYDRFVPHLLNIIKRQQATIESLETRIAALES